MHRRSLLAAASLGAVGRAIAQTANWPTRPVTITVPYVPGGPSDILARALAQRMQAATGQPFVTENRPGANGTVAAQYVARQPADGTCLFIAASGILTINPLIMPRAGYDPVADFTPITIAISAPNLLVVNPAVPATDLAGLLAWLRANPGRASYGSSGIGSSEHLGMELFRLRTGVEVTHIPYAGGGAAATDLLSGTLQLSLLNIATVAPHVQAGRLRAIALAGQARHPLLPEVPTVIEAGLPDFRSGSWHAIAAPRGLPDALADRIHATVTAALRAPEVGARFAAIGFQVEATGRAEMAAQVARELEAWRGVVRAANIATG